MQNQGALPAAQQKPVIHQSQLDMLSRCGLQYEQRYVKGIIIPPAVVLLQGSATHASVEANLKHKALNAGQLLPVEQVKEVAASDLKARWEKEGVLLDDEEKARGAKQVIGEAIDTSVTLAAMHHRDLAPKIQPISASHVERTFRLELKGFPVDLAGTIDIHELKKLRDTKTSGKSPNGDAADTSEQLSFYSLAAKVLDGVAPPEVGLDYLVNTKTPKTVSLTSTRGDEDHREVLHRVERAVKVIESGAFFPASPDNWVCSAKYCGYYDRCPHGARKRVQVGLSA